LSGTSDWLYSVDANKRNKNSIFFIIIYF